MKRDSNTYHILVIEDNAGDIVLIREYLEEALPNAIVTEARTYREATDLSKSAHHEFDIILLDLTLPDNGGENLIRDVIGLYSDIPVIVLTGFVNLDFGVRSLSLGISDYLMKDDLTSGTLFKSIVYAIERVRNYSELVESEKRYSDIFQLSPIPMWVYDAHTLACLNVNQAAIENYGFSRTEFLTMTARDVRPPEELPRLDAGLIDLRSSADERTSGTYRHRRKNGSILIVEVRARIVVFKRQPAILVIANDLTDSMNYVKTIERQNEALHEIMWTQSHVVRAPLARILSLVKLIESEVPSLAPHREYLEYLTTSAIELDTIIRGIIRRTNELESENLGSE